MITAILIGAGQRGMDAYGAYALQHPEKMRVVAVAEPDPARRAAMAEAHHIPPERCFADWRPLLALGKIADGCMVCTQDRDHVEPATAALQLGYHVLCEKPMHPEAAQCIRLAEAAKASGKTLTVCHVLRYSPFFTQIKEILDSGRIGQVASIQHIESVGFFHQAHSFVRGNWRRSDETSPMFLQKCCHDMDLMVWLTGKSCLRLSSFGSLSHFRPENAPAGAARRCLDGCRARAGCPYDAEKIYITNEKTGVRHGHTGWPCDVLTLHPTEESVRRAIETGPYGRCVYFCDNNVVDHQVVNLEMEDGLTVNFTMSAFTAGGGRYTNFMGTLGNLIADMAGNTVTVTPFGGKAEVFDFNLEKERMSGHAGGDSVLVGDFLDYLQGKTPPSITTLEASMESHFIALAAEASRCRAGEVVEMAAFRAGEPGRP